MKEKASGLVRELLESFEAEADGLGGEYMAIAGTLEGIINA